MGLSYKRTLYVPPYNSKVRIAAIVGYAPSMSDDGNANTWIGRPVITLETLTNPTNNTQKMTEKSTAQSLGPLTVALVDAEVPGLPVTHVEVRDCY